MEFSPPFFDQSETFWSLDPRRVRRVSVTKISDFDPKMGIGKMHRDTFHASLGAGRYLLALCWYKKLTGRDISNNSFNDFDVPVSDFERETVIAAVNSVMMQGDN